MGNKRSRRRSSKFYVAKVAGEMSLGALAPGVVTKGNLSDNSDQELFIISADLLWSAKDVVADEGPITFGLAHSDYTAAEIEEWFEIANGFVTGDKISRERANRQIREIGNMFFQLPDGQATVRFNDGRVKRTKLGWSIAEGQTIAMWARNNDGTILTTGTELLASGKVYCRKQ